MGLVRTETTRINGITYTASTMPAARSIYVLTRLTALLGEGVVSIFMSAMGMALDDRDNSDAISAAVRELFSDPRVMSKMLIKAAGAAADPEGPFKGDGVMAVCRDLLQGVTCDKYRLGEAEGEGGPVLGPMFDAHFQGHTMEIMQLAGWVASLNFLGPTTASV